jgi:SPP1 family predicted phage head-tail adaptor
MESGKLDREIVILHNISTTADSLSTPGETWVPYCKPWASVRYLKSSQRLLAGKETSERTIIVKTRWIDGVSEEMRIVFEGRTYRISGFAPDYRADSTEFTCEWIENNNV